MQRENLKTITFFEVYKKRYEWFKYTQNIKITLRKS